jgi:hypothetical protein
MLPQDGLAKTNSDFLGAADHSWDQVPTSDCVVTARDSISPCSTLICKGMPCALKQK